MKQQIEVPGLTATADEAEGLMYDLDTARSYGLYEEFKLEAYLGVWGDVLGSQLIEIPITAEQLHVLFPDVSANLAPGQLVTLDLKLKYVYDYGRVE